MRGEDTQNQTLFSYVRTDDRIPSNHPLRLIRQIADAALAALSGQFDAVYASEGRPSIPPERLLRALLIQAFYSVRSERQLMEQLNYNLLFRWFVGLSVDDPVWDPSTFSKNRERVLNEDFAACFLDAVLNADKVKGLVSGEHFSVDGVTCRFVQNRTLKSVPIGFSTFAVPFIGHVSGNPSRPVTAVRQSP